MGVIPGWGVKIPYASQPKNQNIKQKQYCKKKKKNSINTFKMVLIKQKRKKERKKTLKK